ncbi:MAG: hypothetical protein EPN93_20785 [Spirochaetes bacterium]|nr:MAG: hypothetical protein EPN93_20785 [Spirochaetota bacterium]
MKKLFLALAAVILGASMAHAQMQIDLMGAYTGAGDAKSQLGFGGGLGMTVVPNVNVMFHIIDGQYTKNADEYNEVAYEHLMIQGAVEYGYRFAAPLVWASSVALGWSKTGIEYNYSAPLADKESLDDSGFSWAVYTGLQWIATQHITPFLQLGYHMSMYTGGLKDGSIAGVQILVGVRFTVFGSNKGIMDEY